MPINSSSTPALRVARKAKRRRASGGAASNPALWDLPDEEVPHQDISARRGVENVASGLGHIAKSILWDLPHRAIDSAKGTTYGLRREDFTDVPPDYSPDQSKAIAPLNLPRGGWQPTDDMIGASLEAGMNVMGGTALSSPGKAAGEFVAGAGPRDPALWHGISKVKLPRPISEMSAVHAPASTFAERFVDPAALQGGRLLPLIGDRTRAGTNLQQVNGFKFDQPVPMQGGHGFMAENADKGAAWASGKSVTNRLGNLVRREAEDAPVYGVYTAMGERSGDFSHHVSDTLAEMLKHSKVTKAGRREFDDTMRLIAPDWPGVKSEKLRTYLVGAPGDVRANFAKLMDTAKYQNQGFPSVAEARFATTDPRLLNEQTGASGLSIAKLDPEGRTFQSPDQHLSYDTNLGGQYVGGLPTSIPKEVMYPDIVRSLEGYRDALPGYKPTIDYLMTRTPKGLPVTQEANQKWVDTVSKHLEGRGFKLGAGANDKRAAAVVAASDAAHSPQFRNWFGASKIVDDAGAPRVAYKSMQGDTPNLQADTGLTHVALDRGVAEQFSQGRNVQEVYVKSEKPFDYRNPDDLAWLLREMQKPENVAAYNRDTKRIMGEHYDYEHGPRDIAAALEEGAYQAYEVPAVSSLIKRKGYDGIYMIEDFQRGSPNLAVFSPSQIKATKGSNYDPNKGSIFGAGATDKRAASLAAVDDVLDAERRLAGTAANEPRAASAELPAATDPAAVGPGGGGAFGAASLPEAQATAARWAGNRKPLEGTPGPLKINGQHFVPGPIGKIHDVAEAYMRSRHPDRPYTPPTKYHPLDEEHSKAIAQAYEEMKHTPNDPATKASYDALINETADQYQAIKATGLKIEPIPAGMPDPYAANPRMAAIDVAENNHLWFYPTEQGFGTVNKISDNPMLRPTGEKIGDHELLANDMFRIVHDYFGHLKEGHGFRAAGEDNAWRTHAQMYSDLARPAMTTETRGQNSWVNYGPHGDKNRTASAADTVYADQKVGLLPEWVMRDRGSPEPIIAYHGSPYSFDRFSTQHLGAGEGNQAYGHGLYFAGHEPVSEWYRYQLAARRDPILKNHGLDSQDGAQVGIELAAANGDAGALAATYRKYADDLRAENARPDMATKNMIKRAEAKAAYLEDPERAKGTMYQVAIEADPQKFLDWDKPLQRDWLEENMAAFPEVLEGDAKQRAFLGPDRGYTGQAAYAKAANWRTGVDLSPPNAEEVSRRMVKAGIPGIRYLDQFSRDKGGTYNFVAFSDDMVKILRKYGIAGIPAAGVLGADGEERRTAGGAVNAAMDVARRIKRKKGGAVHVGPIVGDTGGRADKVPMEVPDGAYVIPADIVSGFGEGNTAAGMLVLADMFPESKPSLMRGMPHKGVPILAADGEFVISPTSIEQRWGDLETGHKSLDAWVLQERQNLIETLSNLDPPAQD